MSGLSPRQYQTTCTIALILTACCGCGSQTYEQRVAATKAYFEYRQRVDSALELKAWQQSGVEWRVPKGFTEIPGPAEEGEHDSRQPNFFQRQLPGLLGAWQGTVRVEIPDSDVTELPGWIFVCTNHAAHIAKQDDPSIVPGQFIDELNKILSDELGFDENNALSPWQFTEVRAPQGTPYVKRKTYEFIPLTDPELIKNIDGNQVQMDFQFYRYYVGEIQFAVVTAFPAEQLLDRRERPYNALSHSMEQLVVSDAVPVKQNQAAAQTTGGGF